MQRLLVLRQRPVCSSPPPVGAARHPPLTRDDIVAETDEQEGSAACHCRGADGASPVGDTAGDRVQSRVQHVSGESFDDGMRAVEIEHALLYWQLKLCRKSLRISQGIPERTWGFRQADADALAGLGNHGLVGPQGLGGEGSHIVC